MSTEKGDKTVTIHTPEQTEQKPYRPARTAHHRSHETPDNATGFCVEAGCKDPNHALPDLCELVRRAEEKFDHQALQFMEEEYYLHLLELWRTIEAKADWQVGYNPEFTKACERLRAMDRQIADKYSQLAKSRAE
jgi:hypothetical protein